MIFKILTKTLGGYWGLRQKILNSNSLLKIIYKTIHIGYQHEIGSYLPCYNQIDGPINFIHGGYGVFISGGAKIGANCTIFQQVTIGNNNLIDSKGFGNPTIGNNCFIGAGAKIIGKVKIGNNCRIGANCIVTFNVPDNCVVVLPRAHIIKKELINNKQYQTGKEGLGYKKDGVFILETDEKILKIFKNKKND